MVTIFIIAGFRHSAGEKQYQWMREFFESKGFNVKIPDIVWNNRVMSDYVSQFCAYYQKHKSEENYVLGFSFGAMMALISAVDLEPNRLYLCSLSPYFAEDLDSLKPSWKKWIGHRRVSDFAKFSAQKIARQISVETVIFYGEAEGNKYPRLRFRCTDTYGALTKSRLVVVPGAPHQIDFPAYIDAVKAEF